MAKKPTAPQKDNFKRNGWLVDDKYLKDYALITENNRKSAIVVGRVLYVFMPDKLKFRYSGFMEIWPRLKEKTWVKVSCHPVLPTHKFFSFEEMTTEAYKESFEPLLTNKIKAGILYIKRDEKLVKYERCEKD